MQILHKNIEKLNKNVLKKIIHLLYTLKVNPQKPLKIAKSLK